MKDIKLPIKLVPYGMDYERKEAKKGDVILWCGNEGIFEIHTVHSDVGYGMKTFTNYNKKDRSSVVINHSGIRGLLEPIN